MIIKSLEITNFGRPLSVKIDLPDKGIVLVTGDNGLGKTAWFIEAPAVAGWNKPLRREPLWLKHDVASVRMITDDLDIRRVHNRTTSLLWQEIDCFEPTEFETNTKAQEALESHIGQYDLWRRTSVFRNADVANFTQSTDAERKRLLELMLGLDRFDIALTACRRTLTATKKIYDHSVKEQDKATVKLQERAAVLKRMMQDLDNSKDVLDLATLEERLAEIKNQIDDARREFLTLQEALYDLEKRESAIENNIASLKRHITTNTIALEKLHSQLAAGICPTCGNDIHGPAPSVEALENKNKELSDELLQAQAEARVNLTEVQKRIMEIKKTMNAVLKKQHALSDGQPALVQLIATAKARLAALAKIEEQKKKVCEADDQVKHYEQQTYKHETHVLELEACEDVLGMRGVRSLMLTEALSGLESLANAWLARLVGGDWYVSLSPYSERKSGGVTEAIALDIHGVGGGNYRSLSDGQKRRIDVAFLFALAEMASAAHSFSGGTLLLDEITDPPLDPSGRDILIDLLFEIANERPVVVITHSESAIATLQMRAWRWYHIDKSGVNIRT